MAKKIMRLFIILFVVTLLLVNTQSIEVSADGGTCNIPPGGFVPPECD